MRTMLTFSDIKALADQAFQDQVLRGLEAPEPHQVDDPTPQSQGLFALHLGATFHRRAIIVEVMQYYARRRGFSHADFPSLALVTETGSGGSSREYARSCYDFAVFASPELAEAHYNLARLDQAERTYESALTRFRKVLELEPHARATPHAHLHANAHWEMATVCECLGRDADALSAYKVALAGLTSFGVHHIRVAKFFRKMNSVADAISEFRKGMEYSHRYFPEFLLPSLSSASPVPPPRVQAVYETTRGETVVFWQGQYYALPAGAWPRGGDDIFELTDEQRADARRASSIVRLEEPVRGPAS